jgi:hypothetical protein
MSTTNKRIAEFRRKLRALVVEYNVSVEVDTDDGGFPDHVEFRLNGDGINHLSGDLGASTSSGTYWDFGDGGSQTLDSLKSDLANAQAQR